MAEFLTPSNGSMKLGSNLIIRVKRKRNANVIEKFVVEDDFRTRSSSTNKLSRDMGMLSTTGKTVGNSYSDCANASLGSYEVHRRQILLHRVSTVSVDNEDSDDIDCSIMPALKQKRKTTESVTSQSSVGGSQNFTPDNFVWITTNKKIIQDGNSCPTVMVDISRIDYEDHLRSLKVNNVSPNKGVKILDPLTRMLEKEIIASFSSGNFKNAIDVINQGAQINHQCAKLDGMSILMVASFHANTKIVSYLLSKGADVFLLNAYCKSAIDFSMYSHNPAVSKQAVQEVTALLRMASSTTLASSNNISKIPNNVNSNNNMNTIDSINQDKSTSITDSEEYVMDIFSANIPYGDDELGDRSSNNTTKPINNNEPNSDLSYTTTTTTTSATNLPIGSNSAQAEVPSPVSTTIPATSVNKACNEAYQSSYPIVYVPGLSIGVNGAVEIVFAYDSDWSDLGDDEDPDSNDERFHGNDYPEDGINSDEDEERRRRRNNNNINNEEEEEDVDDDGEEEDGGMYRDNYQDYGSSDDDDDDDSVEYTQRMPKFERRGVGRVLHPSTIGDRTEEHTRSILWADEVTAPEILGDDNEVDAGGDNEDDEIWRQQGSLQTNQREKGKHNKQEKQERLEDMAFRTGMSLSSVAREFHRNGLPKYGQELSDDDIDIEYERVSYGDSTSTSGWRPPKETVAFDPLLDCLSDNDDDDGA